MVTHSGPGGTERNRMGRGRHALLLSLTPSLPCLLYDFTEWPGRDGTEQEKMGPTQRVEATESTRAATTTQEGQIRMLLFLSLFLYFRLFFISLFF